LALLISSVDQPPPIGKALRNGFITTTATITPNGNRNTGTAQQI